MATVRVMATAVVGIKESLKGEVYLNPNEVDGLVILTKERRR